MAFKPPGVRALLLDIEGTTTPVEFVTGTLFPFAREHALEWLSLHWSENAAKVDVALLRHEHAAERPEAPSWRDEPEAVAAYVQWLIDQDRKSTGLKSLQGKIWEEGYRSGALQGAVYDDVPWALERWLDQGRMLAIFSSGSVLAQKLLFAHSTKGDLTLYLHAYFDTTTGPKREALSYTRIAEQLGLEPREILFLSDVVAELDAAREARMGTVLVARDAEAPAAGGQPVVKSFEDVFPGEA